MLAPMDVKRCSIAISHFSNGVKILRREWLAVIFTIIVLVAIIFVVRQKHAINFSCVQKSAPREIDGQRVQLLDNYYACNPVRRGETIAIRAQKPILRVVSAISGDRIQVMPFLEDKSFGLKVNGRSIPSADGMTLQHFGVGHFNDPIDQSIYADFTQKSEILVKEKQIWVFSSTRPAQSDSSNFGPITIEQIDGRVINQP
jgi:hypothetical protein